jgi:hypothetical protein
MRGFLLLFIFAVQASAQSGFADPIFREYAPEGNVKAVAVVVHGLNTRPSRMLPIVRFLNSMGTHVLNVSLSGHRWGTEMDFVTPRVWKSEMKEAFQTAKLRSYHYGVPLNFVGYSLGALAGLATLQEMEKGFVQQAILLAPAISLTKKTYLMKILTPFNNFDVPSLSPLHYRANWGTSVACYNSLFSLKTGLYQSSWENLSFPALVILDPKDELVNINGLKKAVPKNWNIMTVDNSDGDAKTYHHLILDPYVLGNSEWNRMTGAIVQFMAKK